MTDVVDNKRIRELFPALVEAARVVGSVQIRNRATLAGNLCNASPAADTAPPLLAHDANLNLASGSGSRQVPLHEFFTGPGRTVLAPGEIVASIDLPLPTVPTGGAFGRLMRKHGVDLAIVSVCCVARESGEVRFAFGAVGARPFVVTTRQDAPLGDAVKDASPISDLRASADYRQAMLGVIARRTLSAANMRLQESRVRQTAEGTRDQT
jgi:carbon-monoxide dehydrogenase medium subunit